MSAGPHAPQDRGRNCPFCGAVGQGAVCCSCGRDTAAARRPCKKCGRMVPTAEQSCWNCGAAFRSDLWWKIPVIVLLFLAAIIISIAINLG
jgi:RNA polymerase subunit RPABC4/transcription elongation factor Spt4